MCAQWAISYVCDNAGGTAPAQRAYASMVRPEGCGSAPGPRERASPTREGLGGEVILGPVRLGLSDRMNAAFRAALEAVGAESSC